MKAKGGHRADGFTIIEVMIVLIVSMAILMTAYVLVSGRQNKTAFTQSIQDLQSRLQQTINEVGAGYYPNNSNFVCHHVGSGIQVTAGASQAGTNQDCIFLGKALVFREHSGTVTVYTIAGYKPDTDTFEPSTLTEAAPTVVDPSTKTFEMSYGLEPYSMKYLGSADTAAVVFIKSLGDTDSTGALSGSGQVDAYALGTTSITNPSDVPSKISNMGNASVGVKNPSAGISLCLTSGTTNQSGLITIGNNGRSLAVTLQIKGGPSC